MERLRKFTRKLYDYFDMYVLLVGLIGGFLIGKGHLLFALVTLWTSYALVYLIAKHSN